MHVETLGGPIGHAELQGKLARAFDKADSRLLGRPLTFLLDGDTLLFPMGSGGQVECYPDGVVVDEVGGLLTMPAAMPKAFSKVCSMISKGSSMR